MSGEFAEEWVPVTDALARIDSYERARQPIDGMELARITARERVLLPAFAEFSGTSDTESWAFARRLLTDELPKEATHVSFTP